MVKATLQDAEGNIDAIAQANRSFDAGGGYTIGAWEAIFENVAADLVSDLKASVSGAIADWEYPAGYLILCGIAFLVIGDGKDRPNGGGHDTSID